MKATVLIFLICKIDTNIMYLILKSNRFFKKFWRWEKFRPITPLKTLDFGRGDKEKMVDLSQGFENAREKVRKKRDFSI